MGGSFVTGVSYCLDEDGGFVQARAMNVPRALDEYPIALHYCATPACVTSAPPSLNHMHKGRILRPEQRDVSRWPGRTGELLVR